LGELSIQNNQFTFEDIEPNVGILSFSYSPQDSVGIKLDTTIMQGSNFTCSVSLGGSANQYQWTKNGVIIPEADENFYVINSMILHMMAYIYVELPIQ
jgi:hypothetical protein